MIEKKKQLYLPTASPTKYMTSETLTHCAAQVVNHLQVTAGNPHFTAALYLLPSGLGQIKCVLCCDCFAALARRQNVS